MNSNIFSPAATSTSPGEISALQGDGRITRPPLCSLLTQLLQLLGKDRFPFFSRECRRLSEVQSEHNLVSTDQHPTTRSLLAVASVNVPSSPTMARDPWPGRPSTDVLATGDREVAAAVRFVRHNIRPPLSVADVLKVVRVGRRTPERRVRQFLGHSLGRESARIHLERARILFTTTDLPITQIALHSGVTRGRPLAVTFKTCLGQSATTFSGRQQERHKITPN